ncbi:unnamed protein product [Blepharisma stoltei]|uniref:Tim44-like domain-containing protein n=1 Tax=Blepharisma stoltei TaxID=1481888 RepID=A0AAU9JEK3_9CILI|nr:unnamed protein product [Blepharisma stoltei]
MKPTKKAVQEISSKIPYATSIAHYYNPSNNFLKRFAWNILTRYYITQIKGTFLDFDKKSFTNQAKDIYTGAYKALYKGDKTDLNKMMTHPNYECLKYCQKLNTNPPFTIYPEVKSAKLVQAYITSEKGDNISINNFAHITVKMTCEDENGNQITQINVFERRLDSTNKMPWRIAIIEDYNK